ncbi:MAG: cytochrome c-type biogenesis protein CcmH [Gemmatimonadales bacterium]
MTDGRMVGRTDCSRRDFLMAIGGAFLSVSPMVQQSSQSDSAVSRVFDPSRAGRSLPPVVAADNDAAIQAIEKRLKCSCGCTLDIYTCRTTDFTCTYSPALHRQVVALAEEGKSGQEILDAFVAQYGVAVLMAPPKRGFHLAGYFLPLTAVLLAAAFLVRTLRRWTRAAQAEAAASLPPESPAAASPAELERLQRELERLDG